MSIIITSKGTSIQNLPEGADVNGSVNLNKLSDVTLSTPQQDDLLTYQNGIWVNKAIDLISSQILQIDGGSY